MKKSALLLLAVALSGMNLAHATVPYFGVGAAQGWVEFDYSVKFTSTAQPTDAQVRDQVEQQLFFVLYPLEIQANAIPFRDFQISNVKSTADGAGGFNSTYHFRGKFAGTTQKGWVLYMPFEPTSPALQAKMVANGSNLCGGGSTKSTLWLEWVPTSSTCPLKDGVDYKKFTVDLQVEANTKQTYPEYARLMTETGDFDAAIFYGDGTSGEFNQVTSMLADFQAQSWTEAEKLAVAPGTDVSGVKVTTFTKQATKGQIRVLLFQGDSHMGNATARAFHYFYKKAIEEFGFVAYMGHAGYSHNVSLAEMEAAEGFSILPRAGYQIYDVNACLPYFYYLKGLFSRKATHIDPNGTKDLDVISSQVVGYFGYVGNVNTVRAVELFMNGQPAPSYQEILKMNGMSGGAVNGDEDNPTTL